MKVPTLPVSIQANSISEPGEVEAIQQLLHSAKLDSQGEYVCYIYTKNYK